MKSHRAPDDAPWADAGLAAALLAVDPQGTCGISLRALPGPARDAWLGLIRGLLPPNRPPRRIPAHVGEDRLLGGLDLAGSLRMGRPVAEQGILAAADGGTLVLAMAERMPPGVAAHLAAALDTGLVVTERDGVALRSSCRIGVVALDEGVGAEERTPPVLLDRLAFHLDLSTVSVRELDAPGYGREDIRGAQERLPGVQLSEEAIEVLCAVAMGLGIASLRAPLLAARAARAMAALHGRDAITEEELAAAGRLVLAPRATVLPGGEAPDGEETEAPPETDNAPGGPDSDEMHKDTSGDDEAGRDGGAAEQALQEVVLEAAKAAIPEGLLARLRQGEGGRSRSPSVGHSGALRQSMSRGRPAGVRPGEPRAGGRLNLIATLRAAAPWQRIRRGSAPQGEDASNAGPRVQVRREDFRVSRYRRRTESTTIFAVDASGSAALHRLAEAKGAVELLLAECYVRRDQVALVAFRGQTAELLLPPTRSLVRAKRSLAGLPGGGGTPLAAGIDAARGVGEAVHWKGGTATVVLLTDGRANIDGEGRPGRERAEEDAMAAARRLRSMGLNALLVDMSRRPQPRAARLAEEMGATYIPLPFADASSLSRAVRANAVPA